MKKFLFTILAVSVYFISICFVQAEEVYIHPIDRQESECKQKASTMEEWTRCTYIATKAWNNEVDKYYSLLYKKLSGDAKTNFYDDQKYWNLYKNCEIKLLNALYDKDQETKEKLMFRSNQKRNIVKSRAEALRMYYIHTFPDDDKEKIKLNSEYSPDNILIRCLHYIGL